MISEFYEEKNFVGLKVGGKIKEKDYEKVIPRLTEKIEEEGKLNLYVELTDIEGLDPRAIWKDLKFDVNHFDDFIRIAVVGEEKWEKWATEMMKPFTPAEVKFFPISAKTEAKKWALMHSTVDPTFSVIL